MTVWVNRESGETKWERPNQPLYPLTIRQNEADTDEEKSFEVGSSSDEDSQDSAKNQGISEGDLHIGRDKEFELDAKRVLERRMGSAIQRSGERSQYH